MSVKRFEGTTTITMTDSQLRYELVRAALRGGAVDNGLSPEQVVGMLAALALFIDPEHGPDRS